MPFADVDQEELGRLYEGQAHDLYSTYSLTCPSFIEYVRLVDDSTFKNFPLLADNLF